MIIERHDVTREEVIRFYVEYDFRKKGKDCRVSRPDLDKWSWEDPDTLDLNLHEAKLKKGVLTAYLSWKLVKFGIADLLECAVVNHIFPGEPQAICQLILRGKLAEWFPQGAPEWWRQLGKGLELHEDSALIVRPAVHTEGPAKWYLEDGSGRGLALVQRMLRYGEIERTAWAYIGHSPDERSAFIKTRPELRNVET